MEKATTCVFYLFVRWRDDLPTVHTHPLAKPKTVAYLSKRQTDASSKEANVLKKNSKKLSHTTAWEKHFLVIRNDTTYESVGRMWIV